MASTKRRESRLRTGSRVRANVADASGPRHLDLRAHREEDRPRTARATALQQASTTRPALQRAALRSAVLATFFATGCHWILHYERELRDGTPTDRRDGPLSEGPRGDGAADAASLPDAPWPDSGPFDSHAADRPTADLADAHSGEPGATDLQATEPPGSCLGWSSWACNGSFLVDCAATCGSHALSCTRMPDDPAGFRIFACALDGTACPELRYPLSQPQPSDECHPCLYSFSTGCIP